MKKILFVCFVFALCIVSMAYSFESAEERYKNAKSAYQQTVNAYKDARQDWITARDAYRASKDLPHTKAALEKAKEFMTKACDRGIKYLQMIRIKIEVTSGITETERANILAEIDADISATENLKSEIGNANTKSDLVAVALKVKNKWNEVKPDVKKFVGKILSARIEFVLNKADEVSLKISERITLLKANGKDTSDLEALLENFNSKVELAREKYASAKNKFEQIGEGGIGEEVRDANALFREGHGFIKEAAGYLRNAYGILKDIIKELKKDKYKFIKGTGKLYAEGNGRAVLIGSGTVTVSGNGTLRITDDAGDVSITITGKGTKTRSGNTIIYEGFDGHAVITGSSIRVEIEGTGINLVAEGTGTAELTGRGKYHTEGGKKRDWSATGVVIQIGTGAATATTSEST